MTAELLYRGLNLCDGCGAALEPAEQLTGLCARCRATLGHAPPAARKRPTARPRPRPEKRPRNRRRDGK
jgi:predicted amidophosphoribosyltransferase